MGLSQHLHRVYIWDKHPTLAYRGKINSDDEQLTLFNNSLQFNVLKYYQQLPICEGVRPFFASLTICSVTSSDDSFNHCLNTSQIQRLGHTSSWDNRLWQ